MAAPRGRNPIRRLWNWLTRANDRRAAAIRGIKASSFWCDRHWRLLEGLDADPILATRNLTVGLMLAGFPVEPTPHACCNFTDKTLRGVLERSRA